MLNKSTEPLSKLNDVNWKKYSQIGTELLKELD